MVAPHRSLHRDRSAGEQQGGVAAEQDEVGVRGVAGDVQHQAGRDVGANGIRTIPLLRALMLVVDSTSSPWIVNAGQTAAE